MKIASSAPRGPQTFEERNVFAIYVSYYVKVKLTLSGMGGEVSLKLPFILGHVDDGSHTDNRKNDGTKITDCMRSRTPSEILEEEYGLEDEIAMSDVKDLHNDNDGNCNENTNQCDTIQLERQLRFSHINSNNCLTLGLNTNDANFDGDDDHDDDDDDDGAADESCQNIITAQVHHENQQNQSTEQILDQNTEQITDC